MQSQSQRPLTSKTHMGPVDSRQNYAAEFSYEDDYQNILREKLLMLTLFRSHLECKQNGDFRL